MNRRFFLKRAAAAGAAVAMAPVLAKVPTSDPVLLAHGEETGLDAGTAYFQALETDMLAIETPQPDEWLKMTVNGQAIYLPVWT